MKKALFISIIIMLSVVPAWAKSLNRNETVYVNLDPAGKPQKIEVVTWLRTDGRKPSSDANDLMSVTNIKSDVSPLKKGDSYTFDTDEKDIFYSGTTSKPLPIAIQISYFLNGRQVDPLKIKGSKGWLDIRISIKNNTSRIRNINYREIGTGKVKSASVSVVVPFMLMVSTDLPVDHYSNIDAPQGAYAVVGDTIKMNWLVFPFPSDTVTLKAEVSDFKTPSILFTVIPKMPPLPKVDVEGRMNKIYGGIDQLGNYLKRAEAGAAEMNDGHKKLKNALILIEDGTSKLVMASDAQSEMASGAIAINKGLAENLAKLKKVPFMSGKADQAIGYLDIQAEFLNLLINGGPFPEDILSFLREHGKPAPPVKEFPGIKVTRDGISKLNDGIKTMSAGADKLLNGSSKLEDGLSKIRTEGAEKIKSGIRDGADPLMKQLAVIDIGYNMAQKYDRFSGRPSNVRSSVEFLMKTPGE